MHAAPARSPSRKRSQSPSKKSDKSDREESQEKKPKKGHKSKSKEKTRRIRIRACPARIAKIAFAAASVMMSRANGQTVQEVVPTKVASEAYYNYNEEASWPSVVAAAGRSKLNDDGLDPAIGGCCLTQDAGVT